MQYKDSHTFQMLKQISFALVLIVMILQPISQAFSSFSDVNYELVDMDWEDDTDKEETEDTIEEDEKVRPYATHFMVANSDLSKHTTPFYRLQVDASLSIEILIPPPEFI
ncbi:hypothetical protein [Kordia jejudonensis]|uniref:hypothetical protein n=1 Tax=Kordia jejudonensis TaxID=1348245 RepID=UPI0006299C4E|nr:hypothetical protein [Kordia jejudonensis]